ncbi:uncharacterized protein LOC114328120 isoform X2 [Diabrotica virgifera virgifera]|uniref:Uncharacterized protein LOC114328120 isoform X2 n=1 Tax=Diabrotica virgifera virgifera TaxID=50390 RepID=A0A6P7FAV5_DIAVI|nr:uncharacterized protein LOC114328120 isoform X2 [Diabrotica virgifera virgifera]
MFSDLVKYLVLFTFLLFVASDNIVRVKRNDIDLPMCIEKFNVHRDKIIRTQDSQNMGAKYLNELDLGSREECLHLCCETENCDVFVFEEKNSGSCYLFQCGPPEDFKCKFTHHVNYSSAILSINRHLPDLESQIKLTKHEQDLNKLRKSDMEPEAPAHLVPDVRTTPSTTTTTISPIREIIPITKNSKVTAEDPKCTRFQFECRSTRECIAIYNACDGIPQCADGSDEGPELGCPESSITTATALPVVHVNNVPIQPLLQVRYDANIQQPQLPIPQQNMYLQQPQLPRDQPPILTPSIQRNSPETADYMHSSGSMNVNPRLQYESPLQPYVPQLPAMQGQPNWIGHQSNQMPPQIPQYADKASRIFNHKESGFQVPDGQEISSGSAAYPKGGNYYPENTYRQPIQQENWPSDDGIYEQRSAQENIQNRDQKIDYKANLGRQQISNTVRNDEGTNPKHVQEQLAHDLKHSKENMEHAKIDNSKVKITKHSHHEEEQYPDVVAYKLSGADDLEDGMAHTQKGAVLSVSLGLIITFIMAVLIGCRLKVVRRRIRKNGKSYAHDADFLVNGMYL